MNKQALEMGAFFIIGGLMVAVPAVSIIYTALALSRRARKAS